MRRVGDIAAQRGLSHAQIALAWLLSRDVVAAPIVGATKMRHLEDAVASLSVDLTRKEIEFLEEPYAPHPVAGFTTNNPLRLEPGDAPADAR